MGLLKSSTPVVSAKVRGNSSRRLDGSEINQGKMGVIDEESQKKTLFRRYCVLVMRAVWGDQKALSVLSDMIAAKAEEPQFRALHEIWQQFPHKKVEILEKKLEEAGLILEETQRNVIREEK